MFSDSTGMPESVRELTRSDRRRCTFPKRPFSDDGGSLASEDLETVSRNRDTRRSAGSTDKLQRTEQSDRLLACKAGVSSANSGGGTSNEEIFQAPVHHGRSQALPRTSSRMPILWCVASSSQLG